MCDVHCAICAIRDVSSLYCGFNILNFSMQYCNIECKICNMCNMECFLTLLHGGSACAMCNVQCAMCAILALLCVKYPNF